ncbi:hypothetical protein [Streptomyces sp. OE57]|uniref:hypothetical protein n=1 Tax=Streptomyces lacaronensis TaxID=3379885 RepID=UPI0039B757F5
MHLHTGLRFVRMMTGPDTTIRVSSLSPITVRPGGTLHTAVLLRRRPARHPDGARRERYNMR